MAAITDHVLVQLAIDSVGLQRQGFGELAILSHNATSWSERIRRYRSTAAGLADWSATSPEGRAISAAFSQDRKPLSVAVIRATGTVTQRYDFSVVAATVGQTYAMGVSGQGVTDTTVSYKALINLSFVDGDITTGTDTIAEATHGMLTGDGPYRLSNSGGALPAGTAVDTNYWIIAPTAGTYKLASSKANAIALTAVDITAAAGGGTHTLLRAANDVIIAQLIQGLNAVVGLNYLATQTTGAGDTDTGRVTGTVAGNWFSLAIANPAALAINQTHAAPSDVTLATDLANILLEDSGWYTVISLYNSAAYVTDVATWTQANGRTYFFDSVDTPIETVAASIGTDIGATLLALNYSRTIGSFYPRPASMLPASIGARWLSTDPGKATAKFKTLPGVVGLTNLTDTYKTNIRARRMNSYEQVLTDKAFFWEGTVFSTTYRFIDVTRNADWLTDELSKALLGVFVGNDIVPFSPPGIVLMEGAVRGVGQLAEDQEVILPGWTVEVPDFEDISDADKEDRNLRNLKLQGQLTGAIHKAIPATIVLTF